MDSTVCHSECLMNGGKRKDPRRVQQGSQLVSGEETQGGQGPGRRSRQDGVAPAVGSSLSLGARVILDFELPTKTQQEPLSMGRGLITHPNWRSEPTPRDPIGSNLCWKARTADEA